MVKYGDPGRARRQCSRHRSKRQPIDAVSVFFFCSRPLLYVFVSFSAWKRNQEQAVTADYPCIWATQCWVIERNHSGELVKIIHIAEDDHENFGGARVAGRASLVSASLWWDGRRWRTVEACLTFPEWVQGKTGKTQSLLPQKGRLSSEKVDTWPQGKTFAGLLCNRARAKTKLTKNKKKQKEQKERRRKKGTELDPSGKRVPDRKTLTVSFTVSRACIAKHDRIYGIFSRLGPKIP